MMPKVFILNDLNHNFDKAERFGQLTYVTQGRVPIFKTDVMRNMLREGLKDYTPDDYILIAGPALLSVMSALIVKDKADMIKTLVFDAKEQDYVVRHLMV